jgi:hypothetical protein
MIDITDKAPEPTAEINASLTIEMAQHHIFYMAYIESHYPEINIKDLSSAEFSFIGKGHFENLDSRLFNDYLGTIVFNKKDDIHNLKCYFTTTDAEDDDEDAVDDDDSDDDQDEIAEPPLKRRRLDRDSDSEKEEVDDSDNPQRYSPTSPSYCP